jgi:hypothetical protein
MSRKEKTLIELTEEQQREPDATEPARVRDPRTSETYLSVLADVYERMRAFVDSYTRRAGWNEPELDAYERYQKKS